MLSYILKHIDFYNIIILKKNVYLTIMLEVFKTQSHNNVNELIELGDVLFIESLFSNHRNELEEEIEWDVLSG